MEGAVQGREMFFFPITAWEGGPGGVDMIAEHVYDPWEISSSGNFDPNEENWNAFPKL